MGAVVVLCLFIFLSVVIITMDAQAPVLWLGRAMLQ